MKGILAVSEEPLVSIDFRGNPNSSIVDAAYTAVMDGDFVKVLSWYDNEWGFSVRCVDLLKFIVSKGCRIGSDAAEGQALEPRILRDLTSMSRAVAMPWLQA